MATKIRLMRMGSKKSPFYRVVVADSRSPRDGKATDILGTYDPVKKDAPIVINEEKALKWLNTGAIPTSTAKDILSKAGVMKAFHESKQSK